MLYRDQNDETLVMLTLAGEQRAYEVLVIRHQKEVMASAVSVTKNSFIAEDVAQDAFVTAWMKLDTLQDLTKFGAWVCRIAKNCALNTISRYRSTVPLDTVDNLCFHEMQEETPESIYTKSETEQDLYRSMGKLPQKVKTILEMHYFEGLSLVDIAEKLSLSVGTVKWQLFDGRKRLRKDLCAMNEKENDTFTVRVMKKVEELKNWQYKKSKNGFETVYDDILKEVETLPESETKYHALADVLARGFWWIPGKENDALFEKVKDAALLGKNEDVMTFIITREDNKLHGSNKIEFMLTKQIPKLETENFVHALGAEWFWLGQEYCKANDKENAEKAFAKVRQIVNADDIYYSFSHIVEQMESIPKPENEEHYEYGVYSYELRYRKKEPLFWAFQCYDRGTMCSYNWHIPDAVYWASHCDGHFYDTAMEEGEHKIGSDGTVLTFLKKTETVETPCGTFDGCEVWKTAYADENVNIICTVYYKDGVGPVKYTVTDEDISESRLLSSYHIEGGKGLLPLHKGNTWNFVSEWNPAYFKTENRFSVSYTNGEKAFLDSLYTVERVSYDENSWLDMISEIRNDYVCGRAGGSREKILNVYHAIDRAMILAKTPMEKAHSEAACSVAKRILDTDQEFNPERKADGVWNFFNKFSVLHQENSMILSENHRWGFEWKRDGNVCLYNNVYGILQFIAGRIWDDRWETCGKYSYQKMFASNYIQTDVTSESCDSLTVKAGTFTDCIKLTVHTVGFEDNVGLSYMGGTKIYYFAKGVGILRTENEYFSSPVVYELSSYTGESDGYMPYASGMRRVYEGIGFEDGFRGSAIYLYCDDENGNPYIFEDRLGVQDVPVPVPSYEYVKGEVLEEKLWNAENREEGRLRHDINNFLLTLHYIGRNSRTLRMPHKAVALRKQFVKIMETFSDDGEIPEAWLGAYCWTLFRCGCASFGAGQKEEGYRYLEKSFNLYPKWLSIPDGTPMDTGNPLLFGGIQVVKRKDMILLPDGRKEKFNDEGEFSYGSGGMYYAMTAKRGWEWFNSVRNEDRFAEYVKRARKIMDIQ